MRGDLSLLLAASIEALGVPHAFTTRHGGMSVPPFDTLNLGQAVGDDPAAVIENRRRVTALLGRSPGGHIEASQVHGREVAVVTGADRGKTVRGVDGLVTQDRGVVLAIHSADCVPLLLVDPRRGAIAAVHTGWRGTADGAATAALAALTGVCGSHPSDLVAAIGPAIGPCCYEVDAPVFERFAHWRWAPRVFTPTRSGRWALDLWESNRLQLLDAGVPAEAITIAGLCTAHHPPLFFSHRRDGPTGRMGALAALP